MSDIVVWQVLDDDGQPIAIEFTDTIGAVYFVTVDPSLDGVRLGPFPKRRNGPYKRVEVTRIAKPTEDK